MVPYALLCCTNICAWLLVLRLFEIVFLMRVSGDRKGRLRRVGRSHLAMSCGIWCEQTDINQMMEVQLEDDTDQPLTQTITYVAGVEFEIWLSLSHVTCVE